jgi:hypothetical protein
MKHGLANRPHHSGQIRKQNRRQAPAAKITYSARSASALSEDPLHARADPISLRKSPLIKQDASLPCFLHELCDDIGALHPTGRD